MAAQSQSVGISYLLAPERSGRRLCPFPGMHLVTTPAGHRPVGGADPWMAHRSPPPNVTELVAGWVVTRAVLADREGEQALPDIAGGLLQGSARSPALTLRAHSCRGRTQAGPPP